MPYNDAPFRRYEVQGFPLYVWVVDKGTNSGIWPRADVSTHGRLWDDVVSGIRICTSGLLPWSGGVWAAPWCWFGPKPLPPPPEPKLLLLHRWLLRLKAPLLGVVGSDRSPLPPALFLGSGQQTDALQLSGFSPSESGGHSRAQSSSSASPPSAGPDSDSKPPLEGFRPLFSTNSGCIVVEWIPLLWKNSLTFSATWNNSIIHHGHWLTKALVTS